MSRPIEAYKRLKQQLLGWGFAWNREDDSDTTATLEALCPEFGRIDDRATFLATDANPLFSTELLDDWIRIAGSPDGIGEFGVLDPCLLGQEFTEDELRQQLLNKLNDPGDNSVTYFEELAESLGFEVEIEDGFVPFQAGISAVGDPLYSNDWSFAVRVCGDINDVEFTEFAAGAGAVGDPLRSWQVVLLECTINSRLPAHMVVVYCYE